MLDQYQSIITTEELAGILRLNERTILKLVKEGKLPAMKIANQFRFSKEKIIDWIESQMSDYSDNLLADIEESDSSNKIEITKLITANNIIELMSGTKVDIIKELVEKANEIGFVKNKDELLKHVYFRESQYTTAIGGGIAFPHPRSSSRNLVNKPLIMIGTIKDGADFEAVDDIPVKIVILIAVPALSMHLKLLSHLTRVFNDETIRSNIINAENSDKVLKLIKERETNLIEQY